MNKQITIREAVTENDVALFWEQLHTYHKRDIFCAPNDEDLEYFLGSEYHDHMMMVHRRKQNPAYFLFFQRNGTDIGFAMPVIFTSEDGKCFIMEFCVFPEFRGNGTGKECAKALLRWAKEHGALYAELNYGSNERRLRFWKSIGFIENGVDEWGEPLMLLPPEEEIAFTVEVLQDPTDWQLLKLQNGFKKEIGEEALSEEQQRQLQEAVREGKITFFLAKRGYRSVGMCSVTKAFSTFTCRDTGIFEDFYVEPVFRKKGVARMLAQAVQEWSKENDLASLTVCCAPCDERLYQSLGFDVPLGLSFAHIAESSD